MNLKVAAGLSLAVLVVSASITYSNIRQLESDSRWVVHTQQVLNDLYRILNDVTTAETTQRGYIITGNTQYLRRFDAASVTVRRHLDEVAQLTLDNPEQEQLLSKLREQVEGRIIELRKVVAFRRDSGLDASSKRIQNGPGKRLMEELQATASSMISREQSLLEERSQRSQATFRSTILATLGSSGISFLGIAALVTLLLRQMQARARAAQVIAIQAERSRTTLSSIGDAVIVTDENGRIANMNHVAENLTGWHSDEAFGLPLEHVFRIVNEETRATVESPAEKALRNGTVVGLANHTLLIAKDGREQPIDDSAAPIKDDSGAITGVVLVFRDVSERREMDIALREADRRKDEFLATLAHELRNPLAPMTYSLEILKQEGLPPEILAGAREMNERQLHHLVRLVDDLLDVSRISQDKLELRLTDVELASILHQAVEVARPLAQIKNHEIDVQLPGEPIYLNGNATRLAQVFSNLLNNACKFTPPGGRIQLLAERLGGVAKVTVSDNGVGISAEMLPKVFDIFTQADHSIERSQGGLGIGLTLVRRLVELHGGAIVAESPGLGLGSKFSVTLPMHSGTRHEFPRDPKPAAVTSGVPNGTGEESSEASRILVVDDNQDAAQVLSLLIGRAGHVTQVAHDGLSALKAAEEFRPDIALLDIGLPKMNGFQVARCIRSETWGKDMVLIAVTGWGQDHDRMESREAGFDAHVVKPVAYDDLARLLAKYGSRGTPVD